MSSKPTVICVYCGSSPGVSPAHLASARALAHAMAAANISLVYGGGTIGLMGELARTLVSLRGPSSVHGVIPTALLRHERDDTYGTKHPGENGLYVPTETVYGRTTVVPDMHTRKRLMAQEVFDGGEGSGFVGLAGGFGTLEEVFETVTWNQLGIHKKAIVLFNVEGFYDGLMAWVRGAKEAGFIQGDQVEIISVATTAEGVLEALRNYKPAKSAFKLDWGQE